MNNGSKPLIHLQDVTKVFLTDEVETHALSGIHLDIRDGEYISIAGPSGCGKSTLLSILGLLDTPSGGSYALKGSEVANLSFPERARISNREIGFIFQSFNWIGDLTVYENVELPLTYRGRSDDLHGNARRALRAACGPHRASVRRSRGGRQSHRGIAGARRHVERYSFRRANAGQNTGIHHHHRVGARARHRRVDHDVFGS